MTLTYREGLSVLEVIVYTPALVMALTLGFRHGFFSGGGWHFFIMFSLARLVGNACYLATIGAPDNMSLYIAYGVCNSVGLSPLLLGLLSGLWRINSSIKRQTGSAYWRMLFIIIGIASLLGMILSIVGMTTASSLVQGIESDKTKAGMIIYTVSFASTALLDFLIWLRYNAIERGEHRLLWAITTCMPLLAVRFVYSLLAIFLHNATFNMFDGNNTAYLVMDVLEEIVIVYIILVTGLTLKIVAEIPYQSAHPLDTEQSVELTQDITGTGSETVREYKKRPYKGTPLMMLIAFIMNKIDERRQ